MTLLTTPLSIMGLLAVFFIEVILANLSRRFGAVTKMKPYYRGFYVAMAILALPLVVHLVHSSVVLSPQRGPQFLHSPVFYLFTYHLPFVAAVALGIFEAWHYWGWLFRESQLPTGRRQT